MLWFKHFNNARHNPKFRAIERKFGEAGYARAFKLLEIVSERGGTGKDFSPRLDLNLPHIDLSFIADQLEIRPSSTKITLDHFAKCNFIDPDAWRQNVIYIPQMIEYIDEWTRKRQSRNSGATPESVRSNSPQTQSKNTDTDTDTEEEQPPTPLKRGVEGSPLKGGVCSFEEFWSVYPRRAGKKKAERAWKKIRAEEVPTIVASIEAWKKTQQWRKEGGRFIPHPATFLNGRRWEDEVPPERKEGSADTREGEGYSVPEAIYVQA